MTKKEQLASDIGEAIIIISNMSENEYEKVHDMFVELQIRFSSLKREDFITDYMFEKTYKNQVKSTFNHNDLMDLLNGKIDMTDNCFMLVRLNLEKFLFILEARS
jgi:hypothetical protein